VRFVNDPIHGLVLVDDWVADMVEMEAKNGGFVHASDREAFSRIHSSMPASAKVTPAGAAPAFTGDDLIKPAPKPSGWSDPLPLRSPPGAELVDQICKADEQRERIEQAFVRRKLK
jgi:hypothetical protein